MINTLILNKAGSTCNIISGSNVVGACHYDGFEKEVTDNGNTIITIHDRGEIIVICNADIIETKDAIEADATLGWVLKRKHKLGEDVHVL